MFAAFRERDVGAVQGILAADAVWHFPGRRGKLAGAHRGHEGIFAFLISVGELTEHTFGLELEDVVAGDETAVALFRGHGRRGEKELDNPTSLRLKIANGKIVELWEFVWDLDAVEDFWS
jgi:ketosteroid isomerase-like protein